MVMKLENIQKLWDEDSKIDESELGHEAAQIAQIHNRYLKIYNVERLTLLKLQENLKRLKFDKGEFYRDGPTEDTDKRGWEYPARGRLSPTLAGVYVESDRHVIDENLKIGFQQEKLWFLDQIIRSLNNRNYCITNAIADRKWKQGD